MLMSEHCSFLYSVARPYSSTIGAQVMSLWPFKQIILRSGLAKPSASADVCQLQPEYIFHFGDATEIRRVLGMTNRLTGWGISSLTTHPCRVNFL